MKKLQVWISACRLRTLPLSISGAIVGSGVAYSMGLFNSTIFVLTILSTLSLQILSNLANDYGDGVKGTDNQNRIGPERALQSGVISPKQMKNAITINVIICFFFSGNSYLQSLWYRSVFYFIYFYCVRNSSNYSSH